MIRLVAIDMDGTLLRPDGHISERNVRALKGLKAMGAEFLICTGRSYIDALEPLKEDVYKRQSLWRFRRTWYLLRNIRYALRALQFTAFWM